LNPFLLAGIGILLVGIIWNQYRIGKENMKAFIKIPSKGVQIIADRLAQFRINLINEESFSNGTAFWVSSRTNNTAQNNEQSLKKVYENHKIEYKLFLRRYYKYIARVIVCISVLIAITLWDLVTTRSAIKIIYNRQSQLQYANYISNRATAFHMTSLELFYSNNTAKVEGRLPLDGMDFGIKAIQQIQTDAPNKFLEVDGTYNPIVYGILFKSDPKCLRFSPTFVVHCTTLLSRGQPTNMMVVLAGLENLMKNKLQAYKQGNKTTMAELVNADASALTPLSNGIALAEEAHDIANVMDVSMTEKIEEMQKTKTTIIIVFSIALVVVSLMIWFYIFKVIKEVYNDFKNVLQVFPPNLVLSSYLLKKFLQRTSSGPLFR